MEENTNNGNTRQVNEYVLTAAKNENFIESAKDIVLNEPDKMVDFVRQFYGDDIVIYESAFILLLNRHFSPIGWAKISQGGISATVIDVKIVAKYIADTMAANFVFVHNHPSGNTTPSQDDITVTERLYQMGQLLNSNLMDSIIITKDDYRSFMINNDCPCLRMTNHINTI